MADELLHLPKRDALQWSVPTRGSIRTAVIPDAIFALEHTRADGSIESVFYCLEADRGAMPVQSTNEAANLHRTQAHRLRGKLAREHFPPAF